MSLPKASIDLGTNTARLLIARCEQGRVVPLAIERRITRLGGGFTKDIGISPEAWSRSLSAMEEFAAVMTRHGVDKVTAVATSAVRDAVNGSAFTRDVLLRTGICLSVIDGSREGQLALKGIRSVLPAACGPLMAFDVGGGSTEYTLDHPSHPLFVRSLPLGVVRLTEGKTGVQEMMEKIGRELFRLRQEMAQLGLFPLPPGTILAGTAGTATTLAAIDLCMSIYDPAAINNHRLSIATVRNLFERLLPLTPDERLAIPGMEKGREDLIVAGMLITLMTMEALGVEEMAVSDAGLLEGLIMDDERPANFPESAQA